jgi:hypothetical protein
MTVRVTEDGRRRKLSKQELLAKRLVNKGVELNPKFAALLVGLIPSIQKEVEHDLDGIVDFSAQQLLTQSIVQRIRAAAESPDPPRSCASPAASDTTTDNAGGGEKC